MSLATLDQAPPAVTRPLPTVLRDLGRALDSLRAKRTEIDRMWLYHDGEHPQLWMTERVREAFGSAFSQNGLHDNYCELVVEAAVQRLEVIGWAGPDSDRRQADELWSANALDLDQEELYRAAGVAGEAYVIVWPREDGGYDVAVNDARNVHLEYGSARRTDRRWAAKVWAEQQADDGLWRWRANLYYPDEIARLVAPLTTGRKPTEMPAKAALFGWDDDDPGGPHDFGAVPVVRFAHMRRRRSRLRQVTPIQDKINKLAANKMVTAEFLAFPWRYALTADPTFTGDRARVKPGSMLVMDPGGPAASDYDDEGGGSAPTRVGEFRAAELANYDNSIEAEVNKLFTLAPLPRHMMVNPGAAGPSGDAITADEGPFTFALLDLGQMYGAAWRDVWELLDLDVRPVWSDPVFRSLSVLAQAILALVNAGVPLEVVLEKYARWSGKEIEALRKAVDERRAREESAGAAALRAADQGRDPADLLGAAGLLGGGSAADDVAGMSMADRVSAAVRLVQYGWEPDSVADAFRLPRGLNHTGSIPNTVRPPEEAAADVAATQAQAAAAGP